MAFKMTVEHEVTLEEATAAADEVERAVGEICNGKRRAGSIPMQELCSLVQFARDTATKAANAKVSRAPTTPEEADHGATSARPLG